VTASGSQPSRRHLLLGVAALAAPRWTRAATPTVTTLIGTGAPGLSDVQVNNPYGVVIGAEGAVYFCDLDNQRVRRFDPKTRRVSTVAGTGERGHTGDGGPATSASLNMPHEIQFDRAGHCYIAERDSHVVRRVDGTTRRITTLAGTGTAGFSGDGGPAASAALRQPHSIALEPAGAGLLICDIGNHRVRRVDLATGTIDTVGGTGERAATPDGAPLRGTPLNGPRTMVFDRDGHLYLALREGNAIYRVDARTKTLHHLAGTGQQGYAGDGEPAKAATLAGPKGLAWAPGALYIADTENHVIRRIDLRSGVITTVLGTGQRGDGPEPDPLRCALSRPHGLWVDRAGALYVTDSEAHRIRVVRGL
jgi:sugar lactone lactonase YvrE